MKFFVKESWESKERNLVKELWHEKVSIVLTNKKLLWICFNEKNEFQPTLSTNNLTYNKRQGMKLRLKDLSMELQFSSLMHHIQV